jgi:hypothetical protein
MAVDRAARGASIPSSAPRESRLEGTTWAGRRAPIRISSLLRSQLVRYPAELFELADGKPVGNESPCQLDTVRNRGSFVTQVESRSRIQKSEVHSRPPLAAFEDVHEDSSVPLRIAARVDAGIGHSRESNLLRKEMPLRDRALPELRISGGTGRRELVEAGAATVAAPVGHQGPLDAEQAEDFGDLRNERLLVHTDDLAPRVGWVRQRSKHVENAPLPEIGRHLLSQRPTYPLNVLEGAMKDRRVHESDAYPIDAFFDLGRVEPDDDTQRFEDVRTATA